MIRWVCYLLASLLLAPLAWFLPPVLVLFAREAYGPINNGNGSGSELRLPGWLDWFQTPDNSLLGDDGHKCRWSGWPRYFQMVAWLWRNRLYGLRWTVLSAPVKTDSRFDVRGDMGIRNRSGGVAGSFFLRMGGYWQYKRVIPVFTGRCIQINLGWILDPYAKAALKNNPMAGRAIFTTSVRLTDFS